MNTATGRIDFHLHSDASNVTDYYAANAFAIPESYSDPLALYGLLKERGMTLITLTDHNSIDGALEMLDAGFDSVVALNGIIIRSSERRSSVVEVNDRCHTL
jgi:predicted metal-dependent phosphoesterase TrpH